MDHLSYDTLGDHMKFSILKRKSVVLLENGQVLGTIEDFIFDECSHCILAYYVKKKQPCYKKYCPFLFPTKIYEIKVEEICKIGDDLIFINK